MSMRFGHSSSALLNSEKGKALKGHEMTGFWGVVAFQISLGNVGVILLHRFYSNFARLVDGCVCLLHYYTYIPLHNSYLANISLVSINSFIFHSLYRESLANFFLGLHHSTNCETCGSRFQGFNVEQWSKVQWRLWRFATDGQLHHWNLCFKPSLPWKLCLLWVSER